MNVTHQQLNRLFVPEGADDYQIMAPDPGQGLWSATSRAAVRQLQSGKLIFPFGWQLDGAGKGLYGVDERGEPATVDVWSLPGISILGDMVLNELGGSRWPLISFGYDNGGQEQGRRVVIAVATGVGEHPGHLDQGVSLYIAGKHIGWQALDGTVSVLEPEAQAFKNFSMACITRPPDSWDIVVQPLLDTNNQ